jgi:hypothetical protein
LGGGIPRDRRPGPREACMLLPGLQGLTSASEAPMQHAPPRKPQPRSHPLLRGGQARLPCRLCAAAREGLEACMDIGSGCRCWFYTAEGWSADVRLAPHNWCCGARAKGLGRLPRMHPPRPQGATGRSSTRRTRTAAPSAVWSSARARAGAQCGEEPRPQRSAGACPARPAGLRLCGHS